MPAPLQLLLRLCLALACALPGAMALASTVSRALLDAELNPQKTIAEAQAQLSAWPAAPASLADRLRSMDAHLRAAHASAALGQQDTLKLHLDGAQRLAELTDDAFGRAAVATIKAVAGGDFASRPETLALAQRALELSAAVPDELSLAYLRENLAWAMLSGGAGAAKLEPHLRFALPIYKAHGIRSRAAAAQAGMAEVRAGLRDLRGAIELRKAAYDELSSLNAPYTRSWIAWTIGLDAIDMADYPLAEQYLNLAIQHAEAGHDPAGVALAEMYLGVAAAMRGRFSDAEAPLQRSLERVRGHGYRRHYAVGAMAQARVNAALGRGDVDAWVKRADTALQGRDNGMFGYRVAQLKFQTFAQLGRWQEAAGAAEEQAQVIQQHLENGLRTNLAELSANYDLARKEDELGQLRLKQQLAATEARERIAQQQLLSALLALAVLVALLIAYVLWRQVVQRKHFAHLAATDALTGAPNRRAILDHCEALAAQGQRPWLAVIDLDRFKSINDRFGHVAGDNVLLAFCAAALRDAPAAERLGRIGGEEWLLVMAHGDEAAASAAFERIRSAYRAQPVSGVPPSEVLTFSMGCAPLGAGGVTASMTAADRALYRAKAAGRDTIRIATADLLAEIERAQAGAGIASGAG